MQNRLAILPFYQTPPLLRVGRAGLGPSTLALGEPECVGPTGRTGFVKGAKGVPRKGV